jgi:hypothetical protein
VGKERRERRRRRSEERYKIKVERKEERDFL